MAARHSDVTRLLFGSFARGDFSARSDMDLAIILKSSNKPLRDRIADFLRDCPAYPTDVFPLTEEELNSQLQERNPFWIRALAEAIECYPAPQHTQS